MIQTVGKSGKTNEDQRRVDTVMEHMKEADRVPETN